MVTKSADAAREEAALGAVVDEVREAKPTYSDTWSEGSIFGQSQRRFRPPREGICFSPDNHGDIQFRVGCDAALALAQHQRRRRRRVIDLDGLLPRVGMGNNVASSSDAEPAVLPVP